MVTPRVNTCNQVAAAGDSPTDAVANDESAGDSGAPD
jgi:hypothetical protein